MLFEEQGNCEHRFCKVIFSISIGRCNDLLKTNIMVSSATTNKSSRFAARFRAFSRLGSAFFKLQRFKLTHICVEVISMHKGAAVESISKY